MTNTKNMQDIADSLDEAAANLEETLLNDSNDLQEFASKTVYSTFYYFSYGVCFVSFLAGRVIPKTGVVGQGLRDGSSAARDAVDRIAPDPSLINEGFDDPIDLSPAPKKAKKTPAKKAPAKKATPTPATKSTSRRQAKTTESGDLKNPTTEATNG